MSEEKKKMPSLQRALFKTFWKQYIICFLMALLCFLVIR